MPGPRGPTLHVTGKVVAPTAGYGLELRDRGANRKQPAVRTFELIVRPPSGMAAQVISTNEVRHSVRLPPLKPPHQSPFKAVRITCGGRTIATIQPVPVAH